MNLTEEDISELRGLTDEELQLEAKDAEEAVAYLKQCQDAILAEIERRRKGAS